MSRCPRGEGEVVGLRYHLVAFSAIQNMMALSASSERSRKLLMTWTRSR